MVAAGGDTLVSGPRSLLGAGAGEEKGGKGNRGVHWSELDRSTLPHCQYQDRGRGGRREGEGGGEEREEKDTQSLLELGYEFPHPPTSQEQERREEMRRGMGRGWEGGLPQSGLGLRYPLHLLLHLPHPVQDTLSGGISTAECIPTKDHM